VFKERPISTEMDGMTALLFFLVVGVMGGMATIVHRRDRRAAFTRDWIEYLRQDLLT
jgi:hypothetical protein